MDAQAFAIIATGVVLFAVAPRRLEASLLTGPMILLHAVLSLTAVRMIPIALSLIGSGLRAPTPAGWARPGRGRPIWIQGRADRRTISPIATPPS